ncbi:MAG: hypothetical protein EXQ88_01345 [Alphaproteobacteria bacterium]|nr:hypothetical protein [Alphaproteobacteria bacterium]
MSDDRLDYETFVAEALQGVVRRALTLVTRRGLPGQHHFYITFNTNAPGIRLPKSLRAQFPEQMTIVLQHQFHDLNVDEQGFAVSLSFNGKLERLAIPFAAVAAFVDPSVEFGLPIPSKLVAAAKSSVDAPTEAIASPSQAGPAEDGPAAVVQLDKFRKKK